MTAAASAAQNATACDTPRSSGTSSSCGEGMRSAMLDRMPELIDTPSRVNAAGTEPKLIDEYVGRVSTGEQRLSIAHMRSPAGWEEPGQRPDFDEYTVVLDGR